MNTTYCHLKQLGSIFFAACMNLCNLPVASQHIKMPQNEYKLNNKHLNLHFFDYVTFPLDLTAPLKTAS